MREPPGLFETQGPRSRMIHQVIAATGLPIVCRQATVDCADSEHHVQCGLPYPWNIVWVTPLQGSIVCNWSETGRGISTTLEIGWSAWNQSTPVVLKQVDLTYSDESGRQTSAWSGFERNYERYSCMLIEASRRRRTAVSQRDRPACPSRRLHRQGRSLLCLRASTAV